MDNMVDSLENAYQEFVNATTNLLEVNQASGGQRNPATTVAMENFAQRLTMFKAACDQADDFVNSAKQAITNKCAVDEATYKVKVDEFLVDDVTFGKDDVTPGSPIECLASLPITPEFSPNDVTMGKDEIENDREDVVN